MFDDVKVIQSSENSVKKLVFTKEDVSVESVLYKYPSYDVRTVICCSTQCGCPVGCVHCGSGSFMARSLRSEEIVYQVDRCIEETEIDALEMERLQIMFMSMGEPLLNKNAMLETLHILYDKYPNAALLISTIGPKIDYEWVHDVSERIPTIGLQFSVHKSTNEERNEFIPFKKKLTLEEIAEQGTEWKSRTGRKPFFNYCVGDDNNSQQDADNLLAIFDPNVWEATLSVICERDEGFTKRNDYQMQLATDFSSKMLENGFSVRVFDPAGQDDVGGGCGSLWHTQRWVKDNPDKVRPSIGAGRQKVHMPTLER